MDVVVRSRHAVVGQRFRSCAEDKLDRIAKLDDKADRIDIEVSEERNPRQSASRVRVELTCHSRGPATRAVAAASDAFEALDLALDKLFQQVRRSADRRRVHHGAHAPQSLAKSLALAIGPDLDG